jgi:hypothetical protein
VWRCAKQIPLICANRRQKSNTLDVTVQNTNVPAGDLPSI